MTYRPYVPAHAKPRSALLTRIALALGAVLALAAVVYGGYAASTAHHVPQHAAVRTVPSPPAAAVTPAAPVHPPASPLNSQIRHTAHVAHIAHLAHLHVLHLLHLAHEGVQRE